MAVNTDSRSGHLFIEVEPELRRKIEIAASKRDLAVPDYVVSVLQRVLDEEERPEGSVESVSWAQLSAQSFARDWESEEDKVYDQLP